MNKDLIITVMTESFKKSNIDMAIESGMQESDARAQVEAMDSVIKKAMSFVLETLLNNFDIAEKK